jgi:hypothetical protein
VPGLEVEYQKFLERVDEETRDSEWNVQNHPARSILDRFTPLFGQWVAWLEELLLLRRAGYPIEKNHLSLLEWKSLAILKLWKERKSQAAGRSRMSG